MTDKKVGIGIDTSQLGDGFNRIKQSAESLARDIIRSSRAYSTSSKEVTRDIEEQIRAIEKRNKLEAEFRQQKLREARESGQLSPEAFKKQIGTVQTETQQDRLQTQLLREVIDAIKSTSKEEIREDRLGVEKRIESSKTVGKLAPEGKAEDLLKETIQRGMLGDVGQQEISERENFSASRAGLSVLQRTLQSSNIYEAGAGMTQDFAQSLFKRGGGVAAAVLALVAGGAIKSIQASKPYGEAIAKNVGMFGGTTEGYEQMLGHGGLEGNAAEMMARAMMGGMGVKEKPYEAFTKLGVDLAGIQRRMGESGRATGRLSLGDTLESFQLERGAGLDFGTVSSLSRLSRGGGMDAMSATGKMAGALGLSGNYSLLPEYLQTLVGLGQQQVQTLGEVNQGVNIKMIAGISKLDSSFKNPDTLRAVVNSLQTGLTNAQSPQVEALQYSVLSRMNPGASLFELQKMREKGLSEEGYAEKYLTQLKDISGGSRERFFMNIMSNFGTSAQMAEDIGTKFYDKDFKGIVNLAGKGTEEGLIKGRSTEGTADLARETARFSSAFQQTGQNLITGLDELVESINRLIDTTNQMKKDQETATKEALQAAKENGNWFMRALASFAENQRKFIE